jgi:hypothetical protein
VGGYYPLKISFSPGAVFHKQSRIVIKELTLLNTNANCIESITKNYVLNSISCAYSSSKVTITANTLAGGSEMLPANEVIQLSIDGVKYSESMAVKVIDVSLEYSSEEEFAGGRDSTSWKPALYAPFTKFEVNFFNDDNHYVSTVTMLKITLIPTWSVTTSQLIKVEIVGTDHSSECSLDSTEINHTPADSKSITGTLIRPIVGVWATQGGGGTDLYIKNFELPPTEKPFNIQITTYLNNIESEEGIVHKGSSANINANKIVLKDIGTVEVEGIKTVSESSTHSVTLKVPLRLSRSIDFRFTLPKAYDVTETCKDNCEIANEYTFVLKEVLSSEFVSDLPTDDNFVQCDRHIKRRQNLAVKFAEETNRNCRLKLTSTIGDKVFAEMI